MFTVPRGLFFRIADTCELTTAHNLTISKGTHNGSICKPWISAHRLRTRVEEGDGSARDITRLMGSDPKKIINIDDRPGQVVRHTGDWSKIKRVLGWEPNVEWETGAAR